MLEGTYVVMLVTLIVWFGLFAYLWWVDGQVKRLRQEVGALEGLVSPEGGAPGQ